MKTINEVIKALEYCTGLDFVRCQDCPGYSEPDCGVQNDALHYLREYRSDKALWESDRKGYLDWIEQYKEAREKHQQAVIELKKNSPLTWDQLKQMEGKPVWIEIGVCKIWGLNDGVYVDAFGKEMVTIKVLHDLWHLRKEKMGDADGWQAYRKER